MRWKRGDFKPLLRGKKPFLISCGKSENEGEGARQTFTKLKFGLFQHFALTIETLQKQKRGTKSNHLLSVLVWIRSDVSLLLSLSHSRYFSLFVPCLIISLSPTVLLFKTVTIINFSTFIW